MRRSTIAFGRSAVLDEHLGPNSHPPHMSATNIMVALLYPTGKPLPGIMIPAMRRKQELEKLRRLNHAARELASAWRSIHSDVKQEVLRSGKAVFDGGGPAFKTEADRSRLCYSFRDTSSGSWRVAKRTAVTKPAQNHPPGHVAAHDTPGRITSTSENL